MKTSEINIEQIRAEHSKAPQFSAGNTHEAVISKNYHALGKRFTIGVTYWMPAEIEKGNRDVFGEYQEFIEKLYIPLEPGQKVRNNYGNILTVVEVNENMVRVLEEPNDLYHVTKLYPINKK